MEIHGAITNYNGTYGWIALTQVTRYQEPTEGAPIPHTRYELTVMRVLLFVQIQM